MAATSAIKYGPTPPGSHYMSIVDFTGDTSYATGGYSLTTALTGIPTIEHVISSVAVDGSGNCLLAQYDPSTSKLMFFYPTGGGGTVPSSVAQPAGTLPSGATGVTSSSANPAVTVTPGAGIEVKNATDLSGYTVRLTVFGSN